MMCRVLTCLLVIVLLHLAACSSVKSKKITAENKDKILEEIKNSKELTVEETQLLMGYVMRHGVAKGFGRDDQLPLEGKTIGEIIDAQRQWAEGVKVKETAEKETREKAKAAEEKQRGALLQALSVTLYDKGFTNVSYQDYITMKFSYENTAGKDVRGFKGTVVFKDLFGDEIKSVSLKEDNVLKAGETKRVERTLDYNQFMKDDTRLKNTTLDNLKVEWQPETIMFADGSSLTVDIPKTNP